METKITCPLGHSCQKVVDDHIEQCAWYVKLSGQDPQSGKVVDDYKCAMYWQPVLMVDSSRMNAQVASSIQSLRNETVKRQNVALEVLSNAKAITNS